MVKLLSHGISAHQFLKVQQAADVEVAVFDKTGTLTGNMLGSWQSWLLASLCQQYHCILQAALNLTVTQAACLAMHAVGYVPCYAHM